MGLPSERQRDGSLRTVKPQISDLVFVREPETCLVAADVSPHDAIPHQRARKFRELCALPPLLGERAGVRASVSSNPKSKIRNRRESRYVGCYGSEVQATIKSKGYSLPQASPHVVIFFFPKRSVSRLSSSRSYFFPHVAHPRRRIQTPPNPSVPTSSSS